MLLLLATAAPISPAHAASLSWLGTTSGDWLTGTNWSTGTAPTSADQVTVDTTTGPWPEVTLPGAGADLLVVGYANTGGTLTVSSGADLTVTTLNIGSLSAGEGTVIVTGTDSTLTASGLTVGSFGTGHLSVLDGATFDGITTAIGSVTGSDGTVLVSGTDSYWRSTTNVIGGLGTGRFTIADGATAAGFSANLGSAGTGVGTATVTGSGSTWTLNGGLFVGDAGQGEVLIEDGGQVETAAVEIGVSSGSTGTVTVDGTNSSLTTDALTVGAAGNGTLTLSNAGTVSVGTGATVVVAETAGSQGTVNIGAAAADAATAAGTLVADEVAFGAGDGRLNFNHTQTDYVFAPLITGDGSVNVYAGTTTLGDANTYTGGTVITGGTLIGTATSFGSGPITDDGTLVLRGTADASFDNAIDGAGLFAKEGTGTLTLTATSGFTGTTEIRAGNLDVEGALAASAVTVQAGATLSGSGAVGSVDAQAGSTISPGSGGGTVIGTLTVNGTFAQGAGSTYQAQLGSAGASDNITVTGAVTIAAGAVLNVTNTTGDPYGVNTHYVLLTAGGGVSGSYTLTGDTQVSTFYTLVASTEGQSIVLNSTQTRAFSAAAFTPNQITTAGGLESLPAGSALRDTVGALATDAQARDAFNLLSGEIHASAKSVLVEDSRFVRDASINRVRSAFDGKAGCTGTPDAQGLRGSITGDCPGVWAQGYGSWGKFDGNGNAASLSRNIGGFLVGGDGEVAPDVRFGLTGGYGRSTFNVAERASSGSADNYTVGAYGGTQKGPVGLRLGSAYTFSTVSAERWAVFPGLSQSLTSTYNASTAQVFGELGYRLGAAPGASGTAFEPFAGLAYVNVATQGFTEQGGTAALRADSSNMGITYSTLGARLSSSLSLAGYQVSGGAMVGWRHAFGDVTPASTFAFVGGAPFAVAGVPLAEDVAVTELDLTAALTSSTLLRLSYSGQFGDGFQDQAVRGDIVARF